MTAQLGAAPVPHLASSIGDVPSAKLLRQGSPFLRSLLVTVDAITLLVAWVLAEIWVSPAHRSILIAGATVALLTGGGVFLFGALGLYRARVCSLRSLEHARLARGCLFLGLVGLAGVGVVHGRITNTEIVVGATLSLVLSMATRGAYRNWVAGRRRDGEYLRTVLFVGAGDESVEIGALLECHPELGYRPVGVVGDHEIAHRYGQRWCGNLDDVVPAVASMGATGVIVCATALDPPELNRIVHELLEAQVHVQLSSGLRGVDIQRLRPLPLAREPLFYVEPVSLARWQLTLKRAMDLGLASVALAASVPILALAALAIKLQSRGPVLFKQIRVGRRGRQFVVYKLRTMRVGAESELPGLRGLNARQGPLLKIPHDPRVSRLGRILRATSIDELPQLWNVLNGTMSLVGPRPALPDEVANFDDALRAREDVRPGITGLWQVEGRDNPSFSAYRRFDLFYIENWSIGLDGVILFNTIEAVLARVLRTALRRGEDIQLARTGLADVLESDEPELRRRTRTLERAVPGRTGHDRPHGRRSAFHGVS
jgi:exopolysaccharide biosynthesis polyprenyl glycosylphosphotransferase